MSNRKSMTLHVFMHSRSKRAKTVALLDSGATENFMNLEYTKYLHLSLDLHLKAGEGQYLDHILEVPLKSLKTVSTVVTSTTTPPCALPPSRLKGALTAVATVTALCNALTSSHKRSTMCHASRQILSQYLQSLKKVCPLLAATQSARSSPYHGGQGSLGPN
jgi:hypothetical protein